MRWPWTRGRQRPAALEPINHTGPAPDGDTVLAPGQRRSVDLRADEARRTALEGPTMVLNRPLLTRGQARSAAGGPAPIVPEVRR